MGRDASKLVKLVAKTMLRRDAVHWRGQSKFYFSLGTKKKKALGVRIFVAVEKDIVGFICVRKDLNTQRSWWIDWLAVEPAWQGRGVGRTLLKQTEKGKPSHLLLVTSPFSIHKEARRFYRAAGFRKMAIIRKYFAADEDGLLLVKSFRH